MSEAWQQSNLGVFKKSTGYRGSSVALGTVNFSMAIIAPVRTVAIASSGVGLQVYLWTLAQREGTPCVPIILAMTCNNEGGCSGLGDRLISLGSAFWLARLP